MNARGRQRRNADDIPQRPWAQLNNPYTPIKLISDDEVEMIHQASLQILEHVGVKCLVPEAQMLLAKAGAKVDASTSLIKTGREIVEQALKTVMLDLTLTPRNASRAVKVHGSFLATAAVYGPPTCTDLTRGRRSGTMDDFKELLKLTQFFNAVQINGWPVEPLDIEVPMRHLHAARAMLELTDKVPVLFSQSPQRIRDVIHMCATARGETVEEFTKRPGVYSIINTNTPLVFDIPMTTGIMEMAKHNQPTLLTPFIIAGASTPATMASAVALNNAEILFGLVLAQLTRPGAPMIYGAAVTSADMRTGAPAYGLADMQRGTIISGQLARRYHMPLRASSFSSSNVADFASGMESANAVFAGMVAGNNFLMHAVGWLEGGLCTGYEKFVLDCELIQSMIHMLEPAPVTKDTLALDEIAEIGPGGHFFASQRTLETVETAFYRPLISITQNYGSWKEAGAKDAAQRALPIWQNALKAYEQPPLDPTIKEALDAFVAKRTEEGGAPIM